MIKIDSFPPIVKLPHDQGRLKNSQTWYRFSKKRAELLQTSEKICIFPQSFDEIRFFFKDHLTKIMLLSGPFNENCIFSRSFIENHILLMIFRRKSHTSHDLSMKIEYFSRSFDEILFFFAIL